MTDPDGNIHLLAAAYALDALDELERARFERHLSTCASCRAEVDGYHETAARLAGASAEPPPPGLRDRVLGDVERTPQLPPSTPVPARPRSWLDRNLYRVAAGFAALAVALGAANLWLIQGLDTDPPEPEVVEVPAIDWLPEARTVALDAPGDASATWLWSDAHDEGVLAVRGLPPIEADQTYQLWVFHDDQPLPAGVFEPGDDVQLVPADAPARGAETVAVTVEPAGGVPEPTGPIVASAETPN